MATRLFTFGYAGVEAGDLLAFCQAERAVVLDIRANPWSLQPCWRQESLRESFGAHYRHIPQWGNRNWHARRRSLGIEIIDFAAGLRKMQEIAARSQADALILLCQCPHYATCHRAVIAGELERRGLTGKELTLR